MDVKVFITVTSYKFTSSKPRQEKSFSAISPSSYRLDTKVSATLTAQKEDPQMLGDEGVFLLLKDLLLSVTWCYPLPSFIRSVFRSKFSR